VSQPARTVATSPRAVSPAVPAQAPSRRSPSPQLPPRAPSRTPAARPLTSTPPHPHRRARRGTTPAFWVFAAVVVTGMVVGVVSMSALLVQSSFRLDAVQQRIASLRDEQEVLTEQVAAASSPERIQAWARQEGMVMPDSAVVLRVPPVTASGNGA
jgi:cell division protein FtsL